MLILTRKVGETVVIGKGILCTILGYRHDGQLRLGFEAPKTLPINRYEIQAEIMKKIEKGAFEQELRSDETVIERLTSQFNRLSHGN